MATQTVASIRQLGFAGASRVLLCSFASVADTDTWASGLKNVIAAIPANKTDGTGLGASASGGTITFYVSGGGSGKAVDLLVYTRS